MVKPQMEFVHQANNFINFNCLDDTEPNIHIKTLINPNVINTKILDKKNEPNHQFWQNVVNSKVKPRVIPKFNSSHGNNRRIYTLHDLIVNGSSIEMPIIHQLQYQDPLRRNNKKK